MHIMFCKCNKYFRLVALFKLHYVLWSIQVHVLFILWGKKSCPYRAESCTASSPTIYNWFPFGTIYTSHMHLSLFPSPIIWFSSSSTPPRPYRCHLSLSLKPPYHHLPLSSLASVPRTAILIACLPRLRRWNCRHLLSAIVSSIPTLYPS